MADIRKTSIYQNSLIAETKHTWVKTVEAATSMASGHNDVTASSNPKVVEKYREISINITNPSELKQLRSLFEKRYSLQELAEWIHARLEFSHEDIVRHNDPLEIIGYGKGRCGEFSILFTALCLAHNYKARIILDLSDHVWTEVWDNEEERWVHADPSEKRIDDPKMYERDWKKNLKEVYAFENGTMENVTENYQSEKEV